ncbi:MAG: ABC transporter permease [Chloroflexota bacterium]
MKKLVHIATEEISVHLKTWSFWVTVLAMPLIFAGIGLFPQLRSVAEESPLASVETVFTETEILTKPTGYIDYAAIITFIPEDLADNLQAFSDETKATKALEDGDIESYFVIDQDFSTSGVIREYRADPQLLSSSNAAIQNLIRQNLLQQIGTPDLLARFDTPVVFDREGRDPPPVFSFIPSDLPSGILSLAALVVGLFMYLINVGGFLLVRALKRETKARVLEVMVTSSYPWQFIGGKLLGLSSLALAQAIITLLVGVFVYDRFPNDSGPAALSLSTLFLILPFLFLGYLAYCAGILGVAAIWPDLPESTTLLAMARLVTLFPVIGVVFILPNADSLVSVLLTVNPLTATLLMPFRLLLTTVPPWQWLIGLIGLFIWTVFLIWLSGRLFGAYALLTGRSLNLSSAKQIIFG